MPAPQSQNDAHTESTQSKRPDTATAPGNAPPQLSRDDLDRVAKYLSSPIHQIERKPFRPWLMMAVLLATVTALSLLSLFISRLVL